MLHYADLQLRNIGYWNMDVLYAPCFQAALGGGGACDSADLTLFNPLKGTDL